MRARRFDHALFSSATAFTLALICTGVGCTLPAQSSGGSGSGGTSGTGSTSGTSGSSGTGGSSCLGACEPPCADGGTRCDDACVDLNGDPANCGACCNVCPAVANASVVCASGVCGETCMPGFLACAGQTAGCETDGANDSSNCGACGNVCPTLPNANGGCAGGVCQGTCMPGYASCDADPSSGCETNTTNDDANCGSCGTVCGVGDACQDGVCVVH